MSLSYWIKGKFQGGSHNQGKVESNLAAGGHITTQDGSPHPRLTNLRGVLFANYSSAFVHFRAGHKLRHGTLANPLGHRHFLVVLSLLLDHSFLMFGLVVHRLLGFGGAVGQSHLIISMQTAVAQALRAEMEQIRLVLTREMVRRLQEETEAVVGWRPVEVKEERGRALEAAVRLETPVREKTPDKMERGRSSSKKKINITLNSSAKRQESAKKLQAQKREELYSSLFYETPAKIQEPHAHLKSTYQQETFRAEAVPKRRDWQELISVGTDREKAGSGKARGRMINKLADLSQR